MIGKNTIFPRNMAIYPQIFNTECQIWKTKFSQGQNF